MNALNRVMRLRCFSESFRDEYPYIDSDMVDYFGKEVTVSDDAVGDVDSVYILEDNKEYQWSVNWFEDIIKEKIKIGYFREFDYDKYVIPEDKIVDFEEGWAATESLDASKDFISKFSEFIVEDELYNLKIIMEMN